MHNQRAQRSEQHQHRTNVVIVKLARRWCMSLWGDWSGSGATGAAVGREGREGAAARSTPQVAGRLPQLKRAAAIV